MNVAQDMLAAGKDEAPAIYYGSEVASYGRLRGLVNAWASRLAGEGAAVGERVGLFAENSLFFAAAYLGVIRAGCCVVPFQLDCTAECFAEIVVSTGIRRMAVSPRFREMIQPWADRLGVQLIVEPGEASTPLPPRNVDTDALAAIMFTSGSTGKAKGVMVTHGNIACNSRDIVDYLGLGPADRVMAVLPFYYCYGASLLHTHLMAGAALVINNRFMFPEKVLDELAEKRCTGMAGVPSTYQILLRKTRFAQRSFPALRWLQQAGGSLPNPYITEIRRAFPGVRFFVMYGQTEATARLSYLPPERLDDKLGSIGRGLPHTRLEVRRSDGTPISPGSDEVGEIVASGGNITAGYWGNPAETARYFRDGRLYTGDMARLDRDSFIYIVQRGRDFIKAMGNRISPKEVEETIAELPQVVEAAVVGVPDEIWGEAVHAFIVTTTPAALTAEDVRLHCLKTLPNYKVPQHVTFVAELPKTANGKVAKERLLLAHADLR
jgi:long-chain acyl-CoA synthetase